MKSNVTVNKWLLLTTVVLFAAVLSLINIELSEMRAVATRCLGSVKYLMKDREEWMKSQNAVIKDALKICKGDFSPCPGGVQGIIEDEPKVHTCHQVEDSPWQGHVECK